MIGVVEAIRLHGLAFRDVLPETAFRDVRQETHSFADACQAALWLMGIALETRWCADA